MKSRASNPFLPHLFTLAALVAAPVAHAADGTWVGNANWWSDPASWVSGTTPTGTDGTANFTGVNITGNINKPLGGAGQNRTIGNIIFTDATTSSHDLTLSGNILTLDVSTGQPNIDVTQSGRTLTIGSTVAGNDGLQKSGLGNLTLSGNNTFTGNIAVSAGTLNASLAQGGNNPTTGALGNPSVAGREVTVASGATLNFSSNDVLGQGGTSNTLLKLIANGGTIRNNVNGLNTIGPVELNGGTLDSTATNANTGFKLTGTVTVGGSTVSTISASARITSNALITYNVADAVAGSGSDLNVTAVIADVFGAGGVIKTGAGTMTLSNQNTYTGVTRIDNGTLALGHATNTLADAGAVNVNGGTLALGSNTDTVGAVTLTSGSITGSGAGTLTGTGSDFDVRSGTVSAKLGGSVGLSKSTAGTVTLSGANTYSGATAVNEGRLTIDTSGSINSSSGVNIAGGTLRYNASTSLATTVTFTSGTLEGTNWSGNLSGLTIGSGQTISPGNSPGTATTGSQTWAGSGSYLFEINNATGGAGTDPGWDLLSGSGTLDITATSGSPFNILLTSLTLGNIAGDAANFSDATGYNWRLADFVNPITGYAADRFFVNTGDFSNTFTGTFGVALGNTIGGGDDTQLYLTYTPIPEPRAALLGSLGMLMLLRRKR